MSDLAELAQAVANTTAEIITSVDGISRQPKYDPSKRTMHPTKGNIPWKDRNWVYITSNKSLRERTFAGVVVECPIYIAAKLITNGLSHLSTDDEIMAMHRGQAEFFDVQDASERKQGNGPYKNSLAPVDMRAAAAAHSPALKAVD